MLQDVDDIVRRSGALLDDPSNSVFTREYLMPFIDQEYDELDVDLERAGMQYIEALAVFDVPAGTGDLSSYMEDGQPLASMKFPKYLWWKQKGQPDEYYQLSNYVQELDFFGAANIGAVQWRNAQGSIQITPSSIDITLQVAYDQTSTNIFDPVQNVVRGTAHILAARVAAVVLGVGGDEANRTTRMEKKAQKAWNAFAVVLSMSKQKQKNIPTPMHSRARVASLAAGGTPIV